jgi:multidrug resistance efflux pump
MKKQGIFIILTLGLVSAWLAGCSLLPAAAQTAPTATPVPAGDLSVAEGRLKPVQSIELAFTGGGRVVEALVQEGQPVKAGDLLARLDGAEGYRAQIAAAKLEIVQAEQQEQTLADHALVALAEASAELEAAHKELDRAAAAWDGKRAVHPTAFETALKDYVEADKAAQDAQKELDKQTGLAVDAPARAQAQATLERERQRRATAYATLLECYEDPQENDRGTTRTTLVRAIARVETAQIRLDKLAGGPDPDLAAQLDARLESARAAQSAAEKALADLELRAPWSGTVCNWDLKPEQVVSPGQPVGYLADRSAWTVETTDLAEDDVIGFKVGDAVSITVNALPGETYSGRVLSIHGMGEKLQGDMTYQMHIAMEQSDPQWAWNMTVKVLSNN